MGLIAAGATDIGRKRQTNQDSIVLDPQNHFFLVADGMGGHNGGDIASQMAVKDIPEYISNNKEKEPITLITEAVRFSNRNIKEHGVENPKLAGMGTTINCVYFRGANLYVGNVGDSRAYLVNKSKLYQLSKDHSLVQEKLNLGLYDRQQAANDPQKNVLVRTVGFEEHVDVDVFAYKVKKNDIFMSCSDGLHGKVSDRDILFLINKHIPRPSTATQQEVENCVRALIAQANENGGNDNISVLIVVAV